MNKYEGPLDYRKMTGDVKKAYHTWAGQRDRCNNPRNVRYRSYGFKGIRVQYGSREFIAWYLSQEIRTSMAEPTVGRLDHDKDYTLDNIRIEEMSENSADGLSRYRAKPGPKPKTFTKVELFCRCCDESIRVFKSVNECAEFLGIDRTNISTHIAKGSRFKTLERSHLGLRRLSRPRGNVTYEVQAGKT